MPVLKVWRNMGTILCWCFGKRLECWWKVCFLGLHDSSLLQVPFTLYIYHHLKFTYLTDRASEAIRELESIKDKPDVLLCSTMALIHAHKKAKLVDREAVQELETKLRQDRQSCGEMALYFGGMFLWHTGRHDKAREYIDRMIKMASGNKEVGKIIWIYL